VGIISQVAFVVTLAFCAPLLVLGAQYAIAGDPLSLLFFGLAALVLGFEHYVVTPGDFPGLVVDRTVGRLLDGPER